MSFQVNLYLFPVLKMCSRKRKSRPSFFKVMVKDFTCHMQLPPAFVRKYGEIIGENTKKLLRTSSGETWNVELEKMDDDENYYFTRGWNKFAKDVGLNLGEFLVFWFDIGSNFNFDVSVYGTNGCEWQIPACVHRVEDSEPEVKNKKSRVYKFVENEAATSDGTQEHHDQTPEGARPRFELLFKERNQWRVVLRNDFARASGLVDQKAVVLEYQHKQRYWPVLLDNKKTHSYMQEMSTGWNEFRKENGLVIGKSYSFEFNSTKNVIHVKESTNS